MFTRGISHSRQSHPLQPARLRIFAYGIRKIAPKINKIRVCQMLNPPMKRSSSISAKSAPPIPKRPQPIRNPRRRGRGNNPEIHFTLSLSSRHGRPSRTPDLFRGKASCRPPMDMVLMVPGIRSASLRGRPGDDGARGMKRKGYRVCGPYCRGLLAFAPSYSATVGASASVA
jgi:hypothetical protein